MAAKKKVSAYAKGIGKLMKQGKTMKQAHAAMKKGNSKTSKKKTSRKSSKKNSTRRKRQFTIPIALVVPAVNLIFGKDEAGISVYDELKNGRISPAMDHLMGTLTGYHPATGFQVDHLKKGLLPLIAGALVHKFVGGTLGVNRELGRAGVPFIRI